MSDNPASSRPTPEDIAALRASGTFDETWYLQEYSDVAMAGIDAAEHYLWLGRRLGRASVPPSNSASTASAFKFDAEPNLRVHRNRIHHEPIKYRSARVIAFHLPQFHAFDENDAWWGKGFTEWANVKPALSQFLDHYQPHVPHSDIGYYDLSDRSSFEKQISLAKSYGIYGFCFYYYWFAGKRLMQKAIELYLEDKSLDHPFCVCWANENWTRRWDGLDSEVLIEQDHSPEDDLGCIADLGRYMQDDRYIRIDGRPLVLVYRPSLLPDPRATAERWRSWCRENGFGEIYLAYTQSFENEDPRVYGFDAAIEFPPNNSGPEDITSSIVPLDAGYSGKVYDWRTLAERSRVYKSQSYKLFRGVCPGWDNTARRKANGSVLLNNTPEAYEGWLNRAITDCILHADHPDERIVFVNAWNEWAEGAHLEPDIRNGYAYLEATRNAVEAKAIPPKVAISVHAFHPEVFEEIMGYVSALSGNIHLFVTTVPDKADEIRRTLSSHSKDFDLIVCDNRGRDVLPFLKVLHRLVDHRFDYVAKVHTKKSLHRDDGDQWRKELFDAVIGPDAFYRSINALENDRQLGMLGPEGHLVSMDTYLGSNLERVSLHATELLGDAHNLLDCSFFAGTMFIARVAAIAPLLTLGIDDRHFEHEEGQIDGTFAHAVERLFGIAVASGRYRMAYSQKPFEKVEINRTYGFA